MRSADEVFKNIGAELKNSAIRTYEIGMLIEKIFLILAAIGGVISAIAVEDGVILLIVVGGAFVEYLIGCGIIYAVATNRYARGESVALLEHIKYNTASISTGAQVGAGVEQVAQTAAPVQQSKPFTPHQNQATWTCKCGRTHPQYVTSCPCGASKMNVPRTVPAVRLQADEWQCKGCGKVSKKYVSTCSCGKSKFD